MTEQFYEKIYFKLDLVVCSASANFPTERPFFLRICSLAILISVLVGTKGRPLFFNKLTTF